MMNRRRAIGLLALLGILNPTTVQAQKNGEYLLDISNAKKFTVVRGTRKAEYDADEVMDALLGEGRFGNDE